MVYNNKRFIFCLYASIVSWLKLCSHVSLSEPWANEGVISGMQCNTVKGKEKVNSSAPALLFLEPTLEASQIHVSSAPFSLSRISCGHA